MKETQFRINWNSYLNHVSKGFSSFQQNAEFVDMTLAAESHLVKVHQNIVALASPYLKAMLQSASCQHPVIFLNNISHEILGYILEYIYTGEVNVPTSKVDTFIAACKSLCINGINKIEVKNISTKQPDPPIKRVDKPPDDFTARITINTNKTDYNSEIVPDNSNKIDNTEEIMPLASDVAAKDDNMKLETSSKQKADSNCNKIVDIKNISNYLILKPKSTNTNVKGISNLKKNSIKVLSDVSMNTDGDAFDNLSDFQDHSQTQNTNTTAKPFNITLNTNLTEDPSTQEVDNTNCDKIVDIDNITNYVILKPKNTSGNLKGITDIKKNSINVLSDVSMNTDGDACDNLSDFQDNSQTQNTNTTAKQFNITLNPNLTEDPSTQEVNNTNCDKIVDIDNITNYVILKPKNTSANVKGITDIKKNSIKVLSDVSINTDGAAFDNLSDFQDHSQTQNTTAKPFNITLNTNLTEDPSTQKVDNTNCDKIVDIDNITNYVILKPKNTSANVKGITDIKQNSIQVLSDVSINTDGAAFDNLSDFQDNSQTQNTNTTAKPFNITLNPNLTEDPSTQEIDKTICDKIVDINEITNYVILKPKNTSGIVKENTEIKESSNKVLSDVTINTVGDAFDNLPGFQNHSQTHNTNTTPQSFNIRVKTNLTEDPIKISLDSNHWFSEPKQTGFSNIDLTTTIPTFLPNQAGSNMESSNYILSDALNRQNCLEMPINTNSNMEVDSNNPIMPINTQSYQANIPTNIFNSQNCMTIPIQTNPIIDLSTNPINITLSTENYQFGPEKSSQIEFNTNPTPVDMTPELYDTIDNKLDKKLVYKNLKKIESHLKRVRKQDQDVAKIKKVGVSRFPPDDTPQYTISNRGALQLILNHYMYYSHHYSSGGHKRRWRCINYRKMHCPAYVDTDKEVITNVLSTHDHLNHDIQIRKKIKSNIIFTSLSGAIRTIKNLVIDKDVGK